MPSVQAVLNGAGQPFRFTLDQLATRVTVTMQGSPAESYWTADGTDPVTPTTGVEVAGTQRVLAGVTGQQIVLTPPAYVAPASGGVSPSGQAFASIRGLSGGTPTVTIEW